MSEVLHCSFGFNTVRGTVSRTVISAAAVLQNAETTWTFVSKYFPASVQHAERMNDFLHCLRGPRWSLDQNMSIPDQDQAEDSIASDTVREHKLSKTRLLSVAPPANAGIEHSLSSAINQTPKLSDHLLKYIRGGRQYDHFKAAYDRLMAPLEEEYKSLTEALEKIGFSRATREGQILDKEHLRVADRMNLIRTWWRSFDSEEYKRPGLVFEDLITDQFIRGDIIPKPEPEDPNADQIEVLLGEVTRAQEALSWPSSRVSSNMFLPDSPSLDAETAAQLIKKDLARARQTLKERSEDPTGRQAQHAIKASVEVARNTGLRYPPTEIVDQIGLIEQSVQIDNLKRIEREYKHIKRQMRDKGIEIKPVRFEDSEFSFDIEKDELGPDPRTRPGYESALRQSRKWNKALLSTVQFADPVKPRTPPGSIAGSRLSSLSVNSGMSTKQRDDPKWIKRGSMWSQLQKDRDRGLLTERRRSAFPKTPKRTMPRQMNDFLLQRPRYFRPTNNEPRHRKHNLASVEGSSAVSSHGDFEFWDLQHDPEPHSDAPEMAASQQQDGSQPGQKRGADEGLASPSKRLQV